MKPNLLQQGVMTLRMVVESEIASLSMPRQFLIFSDAYLDSASHLCAVLKRSPRKLNYARSSVVLSLAFHAIELFLKAAILEKASQENVGSHDVQALNKRYRKLYPGIPYVFRAPFISRDQADFTDLFSPEGMREFQDKRKKNPWDQRHRYPRNRQGQTWNGDVGFEPVSFLIDLKKLKIEIDRLAGLIFSESTAVKKAGRKPALP